LKDISNRYDHVVIDSAPVMPVTDAQILAALCDVTLLVLRSDKSIRKNCQQARDGLIRAGACILGVVLNDMPLKGYRGDKYYRRESAAVTIERLDSYKNGYH
jgi:Mrp family chromosome partitioning ATPase